MVDKPIADRPAWRSPYVADGLFAQTTPEQRLYLQYLAVLSLLGRVCAQTDRYTAEVGRAFEDANVILEQRGADTRFERCSPGGYSLFERIDR